MIVEYIIHSNIPNYTKLAFNGLKMIQNNTVSRPIKQGMIAFKYCAAVFCPGFQKGRVSI